ncbi:phosphotransferase family protein [Brevibacterium linens]|uniref:phosphotransferase family protein n=1 Tax=Brevibacterium linens TaxID=1703 RepID=UPI000FCBFCD7|nr:phosphotransferase [Brevibacterium linens]AZU01837.1 hypothetical protein CXR29_14985 [Brevibacterium linens]
MTASAVDTVDTRFAQLPFIDQLRSGEELSRQLGFAVRPLRIRVKPGRGAIVAWRREVAGHLGEFADWGFTAVLTSPDKLANARRRAARNKQELTIHEAAEPQSAGATGAVLVSGGVLADPRLGKPVARALDHLGGDLEIIGYNPARRLLLKHTPVGEAPEFVRISAESQTHLAEAAQRWQRAQLPSLPVEFVGRRRTATRSPWWGTGDLHGHPNPTVAEEVGVIVAELHRGGPAEEDGRATGNPIDQGEAVEQGETVCRSLVRLLPEREADVAGLLDGLRPRVGAEPDLREIHGDLSPDQVLIGHSECRIIDLDRAGSGPIGMDLGRWIAACRGNTELHELEQPFLDGYRAAGGEETDLGAWAAWAMLVSALEPWRSCSATWKAETMRIIDSAIGALASGTHSPCGGTCNPEGGTHNSAGGARSQADGTHSPEGRTHSAGDGPVSPSGGACREGATA